MVKCLLAMWETRVCSMGPEYPLEKEMATHSSTLAWKIPWTEEPGRLWSMGSKRAGHDFTFTFTFHCRGHRFDPWLRKIRWRRRWQPTPVFLPGESHGQRSIRGYSPWGCKESKMAEHTCMQDIFLQRQFTFDFDRQSKANYSKLSQY